MKCNNYFIRRRASRDVKELLNFARAQLDGLVKDKGHLEETVKYIKVRKLYI